jgi:hypothetical protein
VKAYDSLTVVGGVTGTPVSFTLELDLTGQVASFGYGSGFATLSLSGGGAEVDSAFSTAAGHSSTDMSFTDLAGHRMTLPVVVPSGSSILIGMTCYAAGCRGTTGGGGASVTGSLSVIGLPAGCAAFTCKGFAASSPTPALHVSWGTLKTKYH